MQEETKESLRTIDTELDTIKEKFLTRQEKLGVEEYKVLKMIKRKVDELHAIATLLVDDED